MKAETRYKNRMTNALKAIAKKLDLPYYGLAPGGSMRGTPDKLYALGSFWFMFEKKRLEQEASKLQLHRIKQLNERGLPAFWAAANPDDTGSSGEERMQLYQQLKEFTAPEEVEDRMTQYEHDCGRIHHFVTQQLEKVSG